MSWNCAGFRGAGDVRIVGGLVVPLFSKSPLSISGPAAGLTAICAMAITDLGSLDLFFLSVAVAGLLQVLLGLLKLGGFTHLIPSAVIKGMLTAIGLILIIKQVPLLIGYNKPDFWKEELVNIIQLRDGFQHFDDLFEHVTAGAVIIGIFSLVLLMIADKIIGKRLKLIPLPFVVVLTGSALTFLLTWWQSDLALHQRQFVVIPVEQLYQIHLLPAGAIFNNWYVWKVAMVICVVASLETLLSIEAIDKIDPENRVTPQSRELLAQGLGNFVSGIVGGIPITSVIVRSAANAEAGARTKVSALLHGLWLLFAVALASSLVGFIPYCVLAAVLIRTGYKLVNPPAIRNIYRQGREQFLPFVVTVGGVLITDILIGVLVGLAYAIYFLVRHTYRAGYVVTERLNGHTRDFRIDLALNVSFLNKRKIMELLDNIPEYSVVEINGKQSVYIDHDILEIFHAFKSKAARRHIELHLAGIPDAAPSASH